MHKSSNHIVPKHYKSFTNLPKSERNVGKGSQGRCPNCLMVVVFEIDKPSGHYKCPECRCVF